MNNFVLINIVILFLINDEIRDNLDFNFAQ